MKKGKISTSELLRSLESEPLVSVIIPVYNVEKYLCRCLDSVITQTYENLEIILVDDGSTDNSGNICDEYARQDKRIWVIHQENQGQSAARNNGVNLSSGEFVAFVDSDDFVISDYIKIMLAAAFRFHADIVQTKVKITDSETSDCLAKESISYITFDNGKYAPNEHCYKVALYAKLYRRSLVAREPIPDYRINEDDAVYYRFAYWAKHIVILDYYSYFYFQTPQSVMRNVSHQDERTDYIPIYYDRIAFYEAKNEPELVFGSRKRFCLVLMLSYASYRKKGINRMDQPRLLQIFREQFHYLKHYRIGILRRCAYLAFRFFPNLTAGVINLLRK